MFEARKQRKFFKKMGENFKKAEEYEKKKDRVDRLDEMIGWMNESKKDITTFAELEHLVRERKNQVEEKEKEKMKKLPDGTLIPPMIHHELPRRADEMLAILKDLEKLPYKDIKKILEDELQRNIVDFKDYLEYCCNLIQYNIEKIKLLITRKKPNWKLAGDIVMYTYEPIFRRCIMHEILTRTKPGYDNIERFDEESDIDKMEIKTRQERADGKMRHSIR